jgi:hypothetical protein
MAQGGGSARVVNKNVLVGGLLLLLLCVLQCVSVVEGATYTVGGRQGWGFQTNSWTAGKRFRAGDTLVFNYNPSVHNLVVVGAGAYRSCSTGGSRPLTSGSDKVTLRKGVNYFICSIPGHCTSGMKIAVPAT